MILMNYVVADLTGMYLHYLVLGHSLQEEFGVVAVHDECTPSYCHGPDGEPDTEEMGHGHKHQTVGAQHVTGDWPEETGTENNQN